MGGHAPQVARSERDLGLQSVCVSLQDSRYGYPADEVVWALDQGTLAREWRRWRLLLRALRTFDVVHFNAGATLMPCETPGTGVGGWRGLRRRLYGRLFCLKDLPLLRAAGKAIFVTFQGDDARQADFCRRQYPVHFVHEVGPDYYPAGSDGAKRARIATFSRFAHGIYALNPDILRVLPSTARFLPYASVDLEEWRPSDRAEPASTLRLVHAPSHKGAKGTRYIAEAVSRLRGEGVAIELDCVENVPRAEARERYRRADVAVDQLLAGWYGGFALEMMALGKPVVAYIRDEDLAFVPDEMRSEIPIINATPFTIEEVLRTLVAASREEFSRIGAASRRYAERWHQPRAIAARLAADYTAAMMDRRARDDRPE